MKHFFLISAHILLKLKEEESSKETIFSSVTNFKELPTLNKKFLEDMNDLMCVQFVDAYGIKQEEIENINAMLISFSYLGEMTKEEFSGENEEAN